MGWQPVRTCYALAPQAGPILPSYHLHRHGGSSAWPRPPHTRHPCSLQALSELQALLDQAAEQLALAKNEVWVAGCGGRPFILPGRAGRHHAQRAARAPSLAIARVLTGQVSQLLYSCCPAIWCGDSRLSGRTTHSQAQPAGCVCCCTARHSPPAVCVCSQPKRAQPAGGPSAAGLTLLKVHTNHLPWQQLEELATAIRWGVGGRVRAYRSQRGGGGHMLACMHACMFVHACFEVWEHGEGTAAAKGCLEART